VVWGAAGSPAVLDGGYLPGSFATPSDSSGTQYQLTQLMYIGFQILTGDNPSIQINGGTPAAVYEYIDWVAVAN
jgi:hypothetical protein